MPTQEEKDAAGAKIVSFIRKSHANHAMNRMKEKGIVWKAVLTGNHNINTLQELCTSNIQTKRALILTERERKFLLFFKSCLFYTVHYTGNSALEKRDGTLTLYSQKQLNEKKRDFRNTSCGDLISFGNDDYVFFSLEVGPTLQKPNSRCGEIAYRISYQHPAFNYSSVVLSDSYWPDWPYPSHERFPYLSDKERERLNDADYFRHESIFNGRHDSLDGLGRALILRIKLMDEHNQERAFNTRDMDGINGLLNGLMRPEVRVPRMISLRPGPFECYRSWKES